MTDYQVIDLAYRTCWKYKSGTQKSQNGSEKETYTFDKETLLEFARLFRAMDNKDGK